MRRGGFAVLLILCLSALPATAGSRLSIRLVRASNTGSGDDAGLKDVLAVLQKSLAHHNYSLVASTSVPLPAASATSRLGSYAVICNGGQKSLAISVRYGRKQLLNTSVSLRDGKPLILGGFPDGEAKLVLVFVAQ